MFRFYDFKSPWSYKNKNKFVFELKRNFSTFENKNKNENKNQLKKKIYKISNNKNDKIRILFHKKKVYNKEEIDILEVIEDFLKKKKDKKFNIEHFDFEKINFKSLKNIMIEHIIINEEEEKKFYGQIYSEKLKSDRKEWLEVFEGFTSFYQWYIKSKLEELLYDYPKELVYYGLYNSELEDFIYSKKKIFGFYIENQGLIDFYNSTRLSSFMYKILYNRSIVIYFLDILLKKKNIDKFYKELFNIDKEKIFNKFYSISRAKELKLIKIAFEAYETLRPDTRRALMKKFLETHEEKFFSNENQGIWGAIDIEFEERANVMEFIFSVIYKEHDEIEEIWRKLLLYRKREFHITGLTTGFTFMDGSIIPSITFLVNFFCNELDLSYIVRFRDNFIDLINSKILKYSYNLIIRKYLTKFIEILIIFFSFFIGFLLFLYIFFLFQTPLYTKYIIPYIFITIPSFLGLGVAWTFIIWWTYLIAKRYNLYFKLPIPLYGIGYNIKKPMSSFTQLLKNIGLSTIKFIMRTIKYIIFNFFYLIIACLKMIFLFFFFTLIDPFFKALKITLYKFKIYNMYRYSLEEFMKTAKKNFRRVDKLSIREATYNRYRDRGYVLDKRDFYNRFFIQWGGFRGWRRPDKEMKNVLRNFGFSDNLKKDLMLLQHKRFKLFLKKKFLGFEEELEDAGLFDSSLFNEDSNETLNNDKDLDVDVEKIDFEFNKIFENEEDFLDKEDKEIKENKEFKDYKDYKDLDINKK